MVFWLATAFWMSLRYMTQLRANLHGSALERDVILNDLPIDLEITVISTSDLQCLFQTSKLIEKIYTDAHLYGKLQLMNAQTIAYEKFIPTCDI